MSVTEDLAALDKLEAHLFAHRHAMSSIMFAGETTDPANAGAARAEALATLEEEAHEFVCNAETGALLERLAAAAKAGELDEARAAQVRVLSRNRADQVDIPAEVAAGFARLTSEAQEAWVRAKGANDWKAFEPYLDRIVAARREMALMRKPGQDPYDTLLDEYERGTSRAFYDQFFSEVKACVVPLVAAMLKKGWQPSRACIEGHFEHDAQMALARELVELEGLNMDALTLAETEHPFTDSVCHSHAYIATHVYEDDVISNVYSMLHEGGHAMYEQNIDAAYDFTSLNGGVSSGVHESQSRFFENYVGRSEAFAPVLLSALKKHFPGRFDGVSAHELYLAVNRAEPNFVRTEADELTYPLHIIIRYEIEQLLMDGEATAADVPALWNERYKSYLGLEVPTDTLGCLQDVHWSCGDFGYFPTYALGGAYGAQLLDAMREGGVDFDAAVAAGELEPIRAWLRERIWRHGMAIDPMPLIEAACGAPFDASHYTRYLTEKFTAIYGL
jgi:carboxypeptidase Taq